MFICVSVFISVFQRARSLAESKCLSLFWELLRELSFFPFSCSQNKTHDRLGVLWPAGGAKDQQQASTHPIHHLQPCRKDRKKKLMKQDKCALAIWELFSPPISLHQCFSYTLFSIDIRQASWCLKVNFTLTDFITSSLLLTYKEQVLSPIDETHSQLDHKALVMGWLI